MVALILGVTGRKGGNVERSGARSVALRVSPAALRVDPGPTAVVGAESDPNGSQFGAADLYLGVPGDCRIYFDRRDNANFHFLDRVGGTISLGLSEAGVEQTFATGKLEAVAPLRLARHGSHIGVFEQGRLVIAAFDDRLSGGSVGFRMLSGGQPISLKVEPREDIHFADDFMTTEAHNQQWRGNGGGEKGDFAIKSLRNPLLSANAFCYLGAGVNVHSVVGQPWWDRYSYDVSLRGPVAGNVGLAFAYQDDKNYGLFRWTARKRDKTGAIVDQGKRELVRVRNGEEEVLAQGNGGYRPDQWYAAHVVMTYGRVSIAIDGHTLMEASDPYLTSGGAGVWCDVPIPATLALEPKAQAFQENSLDALMRQHAVFDDVRINTLDGYEDDFRQPGPLAGGWLVGAGDWNVSAGEKGGAGELQVAPGTGSTKALIGDRRWAQYELEADVRPCGSAAGLVFLHRDEGNYYTALVEGGLLKLVCIADGQSGVVDSARLAPSANPVHLKVSIKRGHVRVTADNSASVETFAGDGFLRGRAGFAAAGRGSGPCGFSRFRLAFLSERESLVTSNAIFEDEASMNDWTSPTSEWYPPREPLLIEGGRPANLLWHRSQFPGDVELMAEPREFPDKDPKSPDKDPKFEMALSVAKDGQGKNNGYVFRYKSGDAADGASRACTVQLKRQGEMKVEKSLPEDPRQLSSVALRRCGKYIVGLVNGRPALQYRDDSPLIGNKVAYYTQGVTLRSEATKITSDNFRNDFFSGAPTGWRTAGSAIAEVTNRWQCDPRWSFFSLKNDRERGKAAALWSKYLYPGDVTVEFFVGNKMEGVRGQPYLYSRDINVTICSDGADLNNGYTFMWGGHNNSGSMILRNGVEVRRHGARIPTDMNYHRYWFSFKVEKQGGRLTFRVDRFFASDSKQAELVYEDPQPLQGDRVAIWTYDHAIMLSRVRISGDGGNVCEHPDLPSEPLKTPYDSK